MNNQTRSSTDVAGYNFRIGDRVMIAVHPLLAGMSGEITALPSADAGIVALDGGARERIPLSSLELEQPAIELESEQVVALESANRSKERSTNRLMLNEVPVGTSVDIETFDVEVLSVASPMTALEARAAVEQINQHCIQIRVLLVELEMREGYKALGYSSMKQLMLSNYFVKARSTLQKELQAGRIEKEYLNLPVGTMPERQLRPLSKLKPEYYSLALSQAGEIAGDRPLTEKDVSTAVATMLLSDKNAAKRSIVDVVKERTHVPLCDRNQCRVEDAVVVRAYRHADLRAYDGYWGIVQHISEHFYHIYISLKGETIQCREEEVESIDMSEGDRISLLSVSSRVSNLLKAELEVVDYAILETIQRSLYLTPRQLRYLEVMEKDYGVSCGK
ncbi:MAG: hypothetical protein CLLPBCKN_006784 [Chroococcidiopsis cubana SAG 39.79]|uniref:KOW domain-containing protein n=1 Tax=Chroococcidiopsis cubana SAG 39.79 TaxID=388085 RepID=A0AB37U833_9CYAN|nr:hypothetical protein [Chroococcidiopsis cubana]MDZ4877349.1 hypothetical protein [Chroococcidiopsis cubana SAG 39.79]PSB60474.1 hypothetical protein C7B79_25600 [Chroococcidiopsis cubana CCALA 043]RUS97512.1 hypothetical protein DSM107010_69930 [Chroococcidiopsis cubana SAG 39.79]